jgi:predicted TIM-barrel fold metal-dependent hydrolase
MSASGRYGPTKVAAGIVGFADLTLGDRVAAVLEAEIAAGGGRFRGVRHSAAWDADPIIGNSHHSMGPGLYRTSGFRAGMKQLARLGLSLDAWVFHPQLAEVVDLARAFPTANIVMCHMGGPLGYGPYAGKKDEVIRDLEGGHEGAGACPNVSVKLGGVMMRLAAFDYMQRRRRRRPGSRRLLGALRQNLHRAVRRRSLHGREQLPRRQDGHRSVRPLERF